MTLLEDKRLIINKIDIDAPKPNKAGFKNESHFLNGTAEDKWQRPSIKEVPIQGGAPLIYSQNGGNRDSNARLRASEGHGRNRLEDSDYLKKNVFDVNELNEQEDGFRGELPTQSSKDRTSNNTIKDLQIRARKQEEAQHTTGKKSIARGDSFSDIHVRNASKEPIQEGHENESRKSQAHRQSASYKPNQTREVYHEVRQNRQEVPQAIVKESPQVIHPEQGYREIRDPLKESTRKSDTSSSQKFREEVRPRDYNHNNPRAGRDTERGADKEIDGYTKPSSHHKHELVEDVDPYDKYHQTRLHQEHSASSKMLKEREEVNSPRDVSANKSVRSATSSKPMVINGTYKDGYHRIKFENGIYEGMIRDNKRNGKGRYTWTDGNIYDGDWVDDCKKGKGRFDWDNGDAYQGEYLDDRRQGFGIKKYSNGEVYEVEKVHPGPLGQRQERRKGSL